MAQIGSWFSQRGIPKRLAPTFFRRCDIFVLQCMQTEVHSRWGSRYWSETTILRKISGRQYFSWAAMCLGHHWNLPPFGWSLHLGQA